MDTNLIFEMMHNYKVSYFLFYAVELKLFDYLLEPITSEEISRVVNLPIASKVDIMLNIFVGYGILDKENDKFWIKDEYRELLYSESKNSFVPMLRLEKHFMTYHNNYENIVRAMEGVTSDTFNLHNKENLEDIYGQAMQNSGHFASLQIGRLFKKYVKKTARVLDIGGGKGNYSISIIKSCSAAKVDLYERREMKKLCIQTIEEAKLSDSISYHSIDILRDEIPEKYDGILMSNLIHLYKKDEIITMFRKVAESLVENGILVLHDFFLDYTRTKPLIPLLFTIDWMMIGTDFNYTVEDIEQMLNTFGLDFVETKRYKELATSIIVFKKRKK